MTTAIEKPKTAAQHHAHLLVSCPDAQGLVAAITSFLASHQLNILDLDQHTDPIENWFFARVAFDLTGCDISLAQVTTLWKPIAQTHQMTWRIHDTRDRRKMAILLSQRDHCCRELLWRWQDGELDCDIPLVISNHPDARTVVERFGIPFHEIPYDANHMSRVRALLEKHQIDLVALARYMRILPPDFVEQMPNRIINIHHSFLPAFAGPKPYEQAYVRGVKVIGATCHYVTEALDAGPIIEQAVVQINHRDTLQDIIRKGADLERSAMVTGIRLHLQNRVLVHGRRTIVFQ